MFSQQPILMQSCDNAWISSNDRRNGIRAIRHTACNRYMQIANMGYLTETAIADFLEILRDEIAQLRASATAVQTRMLREPARARG